ncbi:hypothetical protein OIU34_08645 [Pararhizobium sp. BT-229]|uniref:hypothetical protein n=1 Tax=Pararhizobium sp. BT-229 TaxID=2986923 RepID=UPI0021F6BAC5|nr:hypothetical protein [Pararhizobium sp. BT-229]MCV9961967.1 hypothetical protein [Pararhizobium sp. BT-229]
MQAFVIGTYRTVDGDKADTFKRGADSFPQIDRDSFVIEGGNRPLPVPVIIAFAQGGKLRKSTLST